MSIKATEVGKIFRYSTKFDMSASTELELKLTNPDGTSVTLTQTGGRVTAPATPVTDPDLGSLLASEYMQITTIATDFPVGGTTWQACGIYTDATPKVFHGNDATFTIGDAC